MVGQIRWLPPKKNVEMLTAPIELLIALVRMCGICYSQTGLICRGVR